MPPKPLLAVAVMLLGFAAEADDVPATSTANFQAVLDGMRNAQSIPGVSAVVTYQDTVLFAGASGVRDLESGRKMTPDTVFYAGSLTKLFTAILTLRLVEQDRLSLEDNVSAIADGSVTISHLITHSSGLEREGNFDYWFSANFPDQSALRDYLQNASLRSEPGRSFHYSNIGFAALGAVAAAASQQSFDEALRQRVFGPLDMRSSGTLQPGPNLSAGYSPPHRVLPSAKRPFAGLGRQVGERRIREYHDAKAMTPAFGAYTTAMDLSRLARFLLVGGAALSPDSRLKMLEAGPHGWGLGIRLENYRGRRVARHGGWFAAHRSHLVLDLESGISVVVLANSDSANPTRIAEALLDSALAARDSS